MNRFFEQTIGIIKQLPLSRKILMGCVMVVAIGGLSGMFFWSSQVDFQTVFANVPPEDASQIVEKLKEQKIAYRLVANGTGIMVPADKVYDVRLFMAGSGIPRGGSVGFEIFDESKFGTTQFVQKLNYQRAIQGELARTIKQFREVVDARVMIVMPKTSVFVEDSKPPSASVLLKTRSRLSPDKVAAVVHLVSSSVEDLTPERITVVDSTGRVLSSGVPEADEPGAMATKQLEYKLALEKNLATRIQSMLERIVGDGKAIVRANADMNFDQVDINEEIYDPEVHIIRSRQNSTESNDRKSVPAGKASSVNPVMAGDTKKETSDVSKREDETVNYEINRMTRRTVQPVGSVNRLSVAVVLDGTYASEADKSGQTVRKYVARSQDELDQFTKVVKKAMGYNADREDQISIESFPFSYMADMEMLDPSGFDWPALSKQYGKSLVNIIMILLVFIFIVRPFVKGLRQNSEEIADAPALLTTGGPEALLEGEALGALPEPQSMNLKDRAVFQARQDVEKTAGIVRGWVNEAS
jgi:flagellar M-ring protein FliF